jgi:orotate phosphoribosyltransferase
MRFGLPVLSVNEFITARPSTSYSHRERLVKDGKILVVDDSVHAGRRMRQVREQLERLQDGEEYAFAAVYVGGSRDCVDYFQKPVPQPRMFEWNLYGHSYLKQCGSDIDGVLCYDPPVTDAVDQASYEEWLPNAEPLHPFTAPVGYLVTSRLECYREQTKEWLKKHGIRYNKLYMSDYPDAKTRRQAGKHAEKKAEIYQLVGGRLFIESDPKQAAKIYAITGKTVFCVKLNRIFP